MKITSKSFYNNKCYIITEIKDKLYCLIKDYKTDLYILCDNIGNELYNSNESNMFNYIEKMEVK